MPKPCVDILKNKTTGDFLLVHYAIHPVIGASVGWGSRDTFSPRGFRLEGYEAVLKSLSEYPFRRNADKQTSIFRIPDSKGQIHDAKAHLCLGVRLEASSILIFTPNHREGGGYVGRVEDEIKVELPCLPDEFFNQIEAALKHCS